MTRKNDSTNLIELLLQCVSQALYVEHAGMAVPSTHSGRRQSATGGRKGERANTRNRYPCGYRPRWLDTQMGAIYLIAPKKATSRSLSPHVSGVMRL